MDFVKILVQRTAFARVSSRMSARAVSTWQQTFRSAAMPATQGIAKTQRECVKLSVQKIAYVSQTPMYVRAAETLTRM